MTATPPPGASNTDVPRWVWVVFATLIGLAIVCFAAAIVLGGLMAPPKLTPGKFKPVEAVTVVVEPSPTVMMDLPMMPTEMQLPEHVSADVPQAGEVSPIEVQPAPAAPRWIRNAVNVDVPEGAPMLALVIDDMGLDGVHSKQAVRELPAGVTFSFLPYGSETGALALASKTDGHEILVHVPMEPVAHGANVPELDMGPHGLKVGMASDEVERELLRNIEGLKDLAVGINNHMGSRFTAWPDGMRLVLTVLQREGMMFLDSRTIAPTAVKDARVGLDLPVLSRDVFLDHEPDEAKVREELKKAVALAKKRGFALAIGHPLPVTLKVLGEDLPGIVSSGVVLVPVTMGIGK